VLDVADRGDDQIGCAVGRSEIPAQAVRRQRFDRFLGTENRTPERMILPEPLREELMDEVVRCVLDHLDFFDHDLLLAFDVFWAECGTHDDI
jgi:hypothetical protein